MLITRKWYSMPIFTNISWLNMTQLFYMNGIKTELKRNRSFPLERKDNCLKIRED